MVGGTLNFVPKCLESFFLFVLFLGSLSPRAATPLAARTPYKATPRVRQAQRRSAFPGWLPAAAAEARPRAPRDTFLERTSHACLRPPNTPERLRGRPSVSLEHQHSTPAVLHCAAHSLTLVSLLIGHLFCIFLFFVVHRTRAHGRPTPSECLRKRPSVSLEHQHSTPVVSHCAARSFDPGEPSHRLCLSFLVVHSSLCPRSRPPNTLRVFAKASERFFGASALHACRITLRGALF